MLGAKHPCRSVEVASDGPDHEIEQALQVVGAVEVDADYAPIASERLNVYVSLQVLAKLIFDPLRLRVAGRRPGGRLRGRNL